MATYTSNNHNGRYLQLSITETTDAIHNKSTLKWVLTSAGGSADYYTIGATTVTINGTTVYSKGQTDWDAGVFPAAKGKVSGSIDVPHNSDGSKSITVVFKTRVYAWEPIDYGGTLTLTKIDRTAPTVTLTTSGITASGVTIKATASTTCDRWDYSINGGSSWINFSTASGSSAAKSITGLTPNTTYSIKVRARKSTNQVYGTSSAASTKTLGGSVISSVSTFTADAATARIALSVTVYNTSYTHTLVLQNGSTTVLTISNISLASGANTITLTASQRATVLAAMSTIKSFTGTFVLTTYNGSTQIGTTSSKTATVQTTAANSAPTFSGFTYQDSNTASAAVTGNNQIFIQGISTLKVTATAATAKNGATISSYSVVAGDATKASTATEITVGEINSTGTVPIIVTAIDSRGYTSSTTVNATVIAYEKIDIKTAVMRRINDVEAYSAVTVSGDITPIVIGGVNKNRLNYLYYRYKRTSDDAYSSYQSLTSSTEHDNSSFVFTSNEWLNLNPEYSYYVQFLVTDKLTSDTITLTVPQGTPLLSFRRKKVGVNNRNPSAALDIVGDFVLNGLRVADFVIEQGTSGFWFYRKWNSGRIDLSGHFEASVSGGTAIGGMYYSGTISVQLPFAAAGADIIGTAGSLCTICNVDVSGKSLTFRLLRPGTIPNKVWVNFSVCGTWSS